MAEHYNLYSSLGLDQSESTESLAGQIDTKIREAEASGKTSSSSEIMELTTARAILGDESRRSLYDARLNSGDTSSPIRIRDLKALATLGHFPEEAPAATGYSPEHAQPQPQVMQQFSPAQSQPQAQQNQAQEFMYPQTAAAATFPQAPTGAPFPQAPQQQPQPIGAFAANAGAAMRTSFNNFTAAPQNTAYSTCVRSFWLVDAPTTVRVAYWLWIAVSVLAMLFGLFASAATFPIALATGFIAVTVIRKQAAWVPVAGTLMALAVPASALVSAIPFQLIAGTVSGLNKLSRMDASSAFSGLLDGGSSAALLSAFPDPNTVIVSWILLIIVTSVALIGAIVMMWLRPSVQWYAGEAAASSSTLIPAADSF